MGLTHVDPPQRCCRCYKPGGVIQAEHLVFCVSCVNFLSRPEFCVINAAMEERREYAARAQQEHLLAQQKLRQRAYLEESFDRYIAWISGTEKFSEILSWHIELVALHLQLDEIIQFMAQQSSHCGTMSQA